MDFYIYGYFGLFGVIFIALGYAIFSKETELEGHVDITIKRGGNKNIPGMRKNFSKKHKKRMY